ncbi:hypothetical protein KKE78_01845 [Patescibacteria group bacterium]|nr:hypothetical protein [Patescibacteria group bacterium]
MKIKGAPMKKFILAHLLVIILNSWWWTVIQRNFWVGLLVFVLSFVAFIYFWQNKSRKLFLLLLTLTTVLFFITVRKAFDESIFRNSALDIQQYNKRHEFYANDLGKIYKNKFTLTYFKEYNLPITKLQSNFFVNLDPNLYFFESHPRERLGVEEFKKYSPIFLPFFLVGIIFSIYVLSLDILIYSISIMIISSIISPSYNLGPILFFPVVNYLITIGIILILKRVRYFKRA